MKKAVQIGILVILCGLWLSLAQTPNITEWINDLSNETTFWYNETIKPTFKEINTQKVIIQSPIIVDEIGTKIKKYTIMYSEYTMDQILADTNLINSAKEKTFNFSWTETTVDMEINLYDGIDPSKLYYIRVIPKNDNGTWGQISIQEMRFKLGSQLTGDGVYTETDAALLHAAAGANMSLANISHSCNPDCTISVNGSKKITLSWIAVAGSDNVDIFLQDGTNGAFNRLATVNMSDEKYELQTSKNGEHIFKFVPDSGGTEVRYTVTIGGISAWSATPATTGITKVPKTWPAENFIVILLITWGLYLAYRKAHKKA